MISKFFKEHPFRLWLVPLILFAVSIQDELFAKLAHVPSGTLATLAELALSAIIFFSVKSLVGKGHRKYLWVPICIATGDLFYGLANYIFKWPFPNRIGCLTYVIPYMSALVLIIGGLTEMTRHASRTQKNLPWIAGLISLGVLTLTTINIIVPALFYKLPPMSPFMKTLAVLFTVLESAVIGGSITLLLCASSGILQIGLFGILIMHISDMAIRYQSVRLDLMGMSIFEYGWALGLTLIAVASSLYRAWKTTGELRSYAVWLPLSSIRGMTIGFVFAGFLTLWTSLSIYYHTAGSAIQSAGTLLILITSFAFAVLVADFVTKHVHTVVMRIQNKEQFDMVKGAPFIPDEIRIITSHFEKLTGEIAAEKDQVLFLTSGVTHDLKGSLNALQKVIPYVSQDIGKECGCNKKIAKHMSIIMSCANAMQNTADSLLNNRREALGEPLGEAIKKAATMVQIAHQETPIVVDAPETIEGPRVQGLVRVLSNLITNAAEASPEREPVHVFLKESESEYEIVVEDHGKGIPRRVIEMVERGQPVTTKKTGNGLGLTTMVSWAKKTGVRYRITSAPGRGTKIALSIPTRVA